MIKEILYKWFQVEPMACPVCEVLREQLASSERERRELLHRALVPLDTTEKNTEKENHVPIQSQFIPWRLRQQMLEAEDRKKAQLMKRKSEEIAELEKELDLPLGSTNAS